MESILGMAGMAIVGLAALGIIFVIYYIISHFFGRKEDRKAHLRYLYEQNHSHAASDSTISQFFEDNPEALKEAEELVAKRKEQWKFE